MTVSDVSGISRAMEEIQRTAPPALRDKKGFSTMLLVSEELLLHLLRGGYHDVEVSLKTRGSRCVEILAGGAADELFMPKAKANGQQGQEQTGTNGQQGQASGSQAQADARGDDLPLEQMLNRNLLEQYAGHIDHRYRGGVNRYRIYPENPAFPDLGQEISDIYEQSGDRLRAHPLALLLEIGKRHPFRTAAMLLIHLFKHAGMLAMPLFASNIIDLVSFEVPFFSPLIAKNVALTALALAVNLVAAELENKYWHTFTRAIESGLKMAVVQKIQLLSVKFQSEFSSGILLSKMISDAQFIQVLLYDQMRSLIYLAIDIIWVFYQSLTKLPVMLLYFAVMMPVYTFVIKAFLKPIQTSKVRLRRDTERSNASFKEMLLTEQLVRSQGQQGIQYRSIASGVQQVQRSANDQDVLQTHLNSAVFGMTNGSRLICLCIAAWMAASGRTTIGFVVLFLSLFDILIGRLQTVLDQMPQITQGLDSLQSVNEILLETDYEENGTRRLPRPVRGEISLRDITFSYSGDREPVLKHLSLEIPAGGCVALTGESGSGKSTILKLILGLYSPQEGSVLIDGISLGELDKQHYRKEIAVVPQHPVLFTGTLWENLVYGMPYVTTGQVMDALEKVGLRDMVLEHPDGLNCPVAENGENFSGGQRQRIAIARALLRSPSILLLDEATSALDARSEALVQHAIESVIGTCTMVIIAHRLNTLRKADRIYRIDEESVHCYDSYEAMERDAKVGGQ